MVELSIMLLKLISNHNTTKKYTNKYELREITDNKTNWSKPLLTPSVAALKTWTESYNANIKNKTEYKSRQ